MASDLIRKRIKFAGDVHKELLKAGWDLATATDFVNNIPDADAVEVVHGEWKMYNNKTLFARTLVCSNCNYNRVVSGDNPAYCEKCGADMRGDKNASD